tara:strand:+ start:446 stop:904 length:459 start_codon:yes stop_codon:yes gene_type:complete
LAFSGAITISITFSHFLDNGCGLACSRILRSWDSVLIFSELKTIVISDGIHSQYSNASSIVFFITTTSYHSLLASSIIFSCVLALYLSTPVIFFVFALLFKNASVILHFSSHICHLIASLFFMNSSLVIFLSKYKSSKNSTFNFQGLLAVSI